MENKLKYNNNIIQFSYNVTIYLTVLWRAAPALNQNLRSRAELEKLDAAKDASFGYLWLTFLTFGYLSLPLVFLDHRNEKKV